MTSAKQNFLFPCKVQGNAISNGVLLVEKTTKSCPYLYWHEYKIKAIIESSFKNCLLPPESLFKLELIGRKIT